MSQEIYWGISIFIGSVALALSIWNLIAASKDRVFSRKVVLLNKRSDVIERISERRAKLSQLTLVYIQKIFILEQSSASENIKRELDRLRSNLKLNYEAFEDCENLIERLRELDPNDIFTWERMLTTANEFLIHLSGELEKEKDMLDLLRKEGKVI